MARIGFIGLGAMGGPMAANLVSAGHSVEGFDLDAASLARAAAAGVQVADSATAAVASAEYVFTMLPNGHIVSDLLLQGDLLQAVPAGATLIDSSSIDVSTSIELHAAAERAGLGVLDAPVSGGTAGAQAGTLTFMVGGSADVLEGARTVLEAMGQRVVHVGGAGAGQAAKTCNQLLFGVTLNAVGEMYVLATELGLDHRVLWEVVTSSTGDCRAIRNFCPVPGVVEGSPADADYKPGFAAPLMLKDLGLALTAAAEQDVELPLVASAAASYAKLVEERGAVDSSAVITTVQRTGAEAVLA